MRFATRAIATTRTFLSKCSIGVSSGKVRMASGHASTEMPTRPVLTGVVFDMDGTLTELNLDFAEMKRRIGIPRTADILGSIAAMSPERAAEAHRIVHEMEEEGRRTLRLMEGAAEVVRWLAHHGVRTAMITRNSAVTVSHLHEKLWHPLGLPRLDPVVSRDDPYPPKPHPGAMERVASAWNVPPSRGILMVGDSLANDIGFGVAAGVSTAFLNVGGLCGDGSGGAHATGEISSGVITTNSNAAEPPGPVPAPPSPTATSASTSSLPPPVAASLLSPDITVTRLIDLPRAVFQRFELRGPLGSTAGLKKFETPEPDTDACRAAAAGDASAVIAAGPAALHERDSCGNTPLVWAADRGHVECVARLVAANADVNAKGFLCATAVARASRRGHAEVLEILARAPGVNLDLANEKLQTPLHFAAFNGHRAAVDVLLRHGASTLSLDRKGRTPAEDTSDPVIRDAILSARVRGASK